MAQRSLAGNNIYLRKDGRWEGRLRTGTENGRTVFAYIYAGSYEEAAQKLSKAAEGQTRRIAYQDRNSFQCIASEWMEPQKPLLKPARLSSYTNILNRYLNPEFGGRCISDTGRGEFTVLASGLLESGGQGPGRQVRQTAETAAGELPRSLPALEIRQMHLHSGGEGVRSAAFHFS